MKYPAETLSQPVINRRPVEMDDDTINIFGLLNTLWLGKRIIAAYRFWATLVGNCQAFVASTLVYRARSAVILDTDRTWPVVLHGVVVGIFGGSREVKSKIGVLRARSLVGAL